MNNSVVEQIKTCADMGVPILVDKNIGIIHCPKLKDLQYGLLLYLHYVNKYIEFYNLHKDNFIIELFNNEIIRDFTTFVMMFYDCDNANYNIDIQQIKFFKNIDDKQIQIALLSNDNISLFIDVLKIIHHNFENEYLEEDEKDSKLIREMKKRIKEEKKKIAKIKAENNADELSLHTIISALCARHPSINSLNVSELSYYQLIDQFAMINKIDAWSVNMNALSYGNIDKDKQREIKHYTAKADD